MRRFSSFLIAVLMAAPLTLNAQETYVLIGKIEDAASGEPVHAADVLILDRNSRVLEYTISDNGQFTFKNVQVRDLTISAMLVGYKTFTKDVTVAGPETDLGTIKLVPDTSLEGASISSERRKIIYKLDKQIISGSANVAATGGTAVEILSSMPSVRIDADGEITFRGSSNFLVYVNGKRSMLEGTAALRQIPAASIEDIEIITTPSARYQTDGSVGIINLITKNPFGDDFGGSVNLTGSTHGTWGTDILLSYKKGKSRFYGGTTFEDIKNKSDFSQQKTTIVDNYTTFSNADGTRFSSFGTRIGRVGWEFSDGGRHEIVLDLQHGTTSNWRGGDMTYYENRKLHEETVKDNTYDSQDRYRLHKHLTQFSPTYKWTINEKGDNLSFTGRFRYDAYSLEYTESNLLFTNGDRYEGTRGFEEEHHDDYDATLAYENKFGEHGKFETGIQYVYYTEIGAGDRGYKITYWVPEIKDFVWQDDLKADYFYRRRTHSLYAMVTDKIGKLSYDAGLRGDFVIDEMNLSFGENSWDVREKIPGIFPSAHLSYTMNDRHSLSAGYSYRTDRPGIWLREPYITYEDYYTKKTGNPHLRPVYAHSMEVGYNGNFGKENHVALKAYYRSRKDVTDWIRVAYEPGVTLDSIVNAGNDITIGLEMTSTMKVRPWWSATLNGDVFKYRFTPNIQECTNNSNFSYAAALINNFNIDNKTKAQFDANFVGPGIISQGREDAYFYFNLAVTRSFLDGRLIAGAVARDIFHTARYNKFRGTQNLVSITKVRPVYPLITLSLSYVFKSGNHKTRSSSSNLFEGKDF